MKNRNKKILSLVVSVIALVFVGVVGTVAYLIAESGSVTNTFTAGTLPPIVVEDFDGSTKKDVHIQNVGTVDAYIRAKVLISWVNSSDTSQISSEIPQEGRDYTIQYGSVSNSTAWILGIDGYYYWPEVVGAGDLTGILIDEVKMNDGVVAPEGYQLSVEILSQSIQADGEDSNGKKPVILTWGTASAGGKGGSVKSVRDDKSLEIETLTSGTGE